MTEEALENGQEEVDQEELIDLTLVRWPGIKQLLEELDEMELPDTPFAAECGALAKQYNAKMRRFLLEEGDVYGEDLHQVTHEAYQEVIAPVLLHADALPEQVEDAIDMTLESLDESAFGKFLAEKEAVIPSDDEYETFQLDPILYLHHREEYQAEFRKKNSGMPANEIQDEFDQMDLHCKDTILLMQKGLVRAYYDLQLKHSNGSKMNRASIDAFVHFLQGELDQLHCESESEFEHSMVRVSQIYIDSIKQQLDAKQVFQEKDFEALQQKASRVAAKLMLGKNLTVEEIGKMTNHYVEQSEDSSYHAFMMKQRMPIDTDPAEYYAVNKEMLDKKFRVYARKHDIDADEEIHNYEMAARLLGLLALNSHILGSFQRHLATPFGIKGEEVIPESAPKYMIRKRDVTALCSALEKLHIVPEGPEHAKAAAPANKYLDQLIQRLKDKDILTSDGYEHMETVTYSNALRDVVDFNKMVLSNGQTLAEALTERLNEDARSPYIAFLRRMGCIDEKSDLLTSRYEEKHAAYEKEFPFSEEAEGIDAQKAIDDFKAHHKAFELRAMSQKVEKMVQEKMENCERHERSDSAWGRG